MSDIRTIDLQKQNFAIFNSVRGVVRTIVVPHMHYYAQSIGVLPQSVLINLMNLG